MKKEHLIIIFLCLAALPTLAQTVVSGRVTDKQGNAVPNVTITIPGSNVEKKTNLDGTFVFETSSEPRRLTFNSTGRRPETVRYSKGMTVRMKSLTWWTERPQRWQFFVGAEVMRNLDGEATPVGLRIAAAKQFGLYAHFAMTGVPDNLGKQSESERVAVGSHYKRSTTIVGGGAMVRLGCPLYFYAGAAMRSDRFFVEHIGADDQPNGYIEATGDFLKINYESDYIRDGIMGEAGMMLNYRWLYANVGALVGEEDVFITLGAGVKF